MGITITEVKRRWQEAKAGLNAAAADVMQEHAPEIVDLARQQLYEEGVDGNGDTLAKYKSDKYARRKNQMNPRPGFGNPDLRLTGAFYDAYNLQADADSFIIGSADQKAAWLVARYGLKIFRLTITSQNTVRRDMLQPGLVQFLRNTTGAR